MVLGIRLMPLDAWNEGWRAANEALGDRRMLTDEDVAALRDFFPRMLVATLAKDPATARAVYKINPSWLPHRIRRQVEAEMPSGVWPPRSGGLEQIDRY